MLFSIKDNDLKRRYNLDSGGGIKGTSQKAMVFGYSLVLQVNSGYGEGFWEEWGCWCRGGGGVWLPQI